MNGSKPWLCNILNRLDQTDPGPRGLADLAARPETEALRVWLAHRAHLLVVEQARVPSKTPQAGHKELAEFIENAAVLDFIKNLMAVLEPNLP